MGTKPPKRLRLTGGWGEPMIMERAQLRADSVHGLMESKSTAQKFASAVLGRSIRDLVPRSVAVRDVTQIEVRKIDDGASAGFVLLVVGATAASLVILHKQLSGFKPFAPASQRMPSP